jgi:hypothetical protein
MSPTKVKKRYFVIAGLILWLGPDCLAKIPDPECLDWFKASKTKSGSSSCEIDCANIPIDMGTFACPSECDVLCKTKSDKNLTSKFIYYPGLTPAETALSEKHPTDTVLVFIQKTRAEFASNRLFPTQGLNDEGDAFRHFMWAGLLNNSIGKARAMEFLDAHEMNRLQPLDERAMDESNNRAGIEAAQQLIDAKKFSIDKLEQKALDALRKKQLTVINPGLPIPEEIK